MIGNGTWQAIIDEDTHRGVVASCLIRSDVRRRCLNVNTSEAVCTGAVCVMACCMPCFPAVRDP